MAAAAAAMAAEVIERKNHMVSNFIKIDSFLDQPTWDALLSYFKNTAAFRYGWSSAKTVTEFTHWHLDFLNKPGSNQENHEHILYNSPGYKVIADTWTQLKSFHLQGHSLVRCYANAHTYGVEGAPHTDGMVDGHFTTIIYVIPNWKTEWAGETVFFNGAGDITDAILPKPNRMITFDGTQLHAARSLARICPDLRITLMFKTKAPKAAHE